MVREDPGCRREFGLERGARGGRRGEGGEPCGVGRGWGGEGVERERGGGIVVEGRVGLVLQRREGRTPSRPRFLTKLHHSPLLRLPLPLTLLTLPPPLSAASALPLKLVFLDAQIPILVVSLLANPPRRPRRVRRIDRGRNELGVRDSARETTRGLEDGEPSWGGTGEGEELLAGTKDVPAESAFLRARWGQ